MKSANRVLGPQDRVSPQQTASSLSPSRARQRGDAELELKSKLFFLSGKVLKLLKKGKFNHLWMVWITGSSRVTEDL